MTAPAALGLAASLLFAPAAILAAETVTASPPQRLEQTDLNQARLLPYVGESFRVFHGEGDQGAHRVEELTLIAVQDAGSDETLDQFSLSFRGDAESALRKTSYTFEHANGSSIRFFIEPSGADARGRYFVSRFSLLRRFNPAQTPRPSPQRNSRASKPPPHPEVGAAAAR